MSKVWSTRINEILEDPKKKKLAAALFYLVNSAVDSPITRKRTSPEELLLQEAYSIVNFAEKEEQQK